MAESRCHLRQVLAFRGTEPAIPTVCGQGNLEEQKIFEHTCSCVCRKQTHKIQSTKTTPNSRANLGVLMRVEREGLETSPFGGRWRFGWRAVDCEVQKKVFNFEILRTKLARVQISDNLAKNLEIRKCGRKMCLSKRRM